MIIRQRYSTMFKTSVHCLLILFIFENVFVQGSIDERDLEKKSKPLDVEISHDESTPKKTELSGINVTETVKSAKVLIKNNYATNGTKDNKTSDLKFKPQNATTTDTTTNATINTTTSTTVAHSDNKDEGKTDGDNEHDTEKEGTSSKPNVSTTKTSTTKSISETDADNKNRTEITQNIEETTTVSDLTTINGSEKSSTIVSSSSEASTSTSNSPSPTNDSTTSVKPSSTEETATSEVPPNSESSLEENQTDSMSSGIIALVMAIVFAVVVIIVYVGLLVWRRYLEYRYGNRELLVNDLEFDTNDLRHFEL